MALATKCPHCNTIFRVAADQLKLRGGIVRCGSCALVFDGNAALVEPAPKPTPVIPDVVAETPPAKPAISEYVHGSPVDFEIDFDEEPAAAPAAAAAAAAKPAEAGPAAAPPAVWRTATTPAAGTPSVASAPAPAPVAAQPAAKAPTPDDIAIAAVARAFAAATTHPAPVPASPPPQSPAAEAPASPLPQPAEPSPAAAPVAARTTTRAPSSPPTRSLLDVVSPDAAFTAAAEPSPPLVPDHKATGATPAQARSAAGPSSLADLVAPDAIFAATAEESPPLAPAPTTQAPSAAGSAPLSDVLSPDATFSAATETAPAAAAPATPAPRTTFTPTPAPTPAAAPPLAPVAESLPEAPLEVEAPSPAIATPQPHDDVPAEPVQAAEESTLAPEQVPAFEAPSAQATGEAAHPTQQALAVETPPDLDENSAEPPHVAEDSTLAPEPVPVVEAPTSVDHAVPPADTEVPPVQVTEEHTLPPYQEEAPAELPVAAEENAPPQEDAPAFAAPAPQDEEHAAAEAGEQAGAALVDALDQWSADSTPPDGRVEPSLDTPQEHLVVAVLDDAHHLEDLPSDEQPEPVAPVAETETHAASEPWSLSEPDQTALHAVAAVNTDAPDDGASVTDEEPVEQPKSRRERALKRAKSRRDASGPAAEHEVFAPEENGPPQESSAEDVAARMRAIAGVADDGEPAAEDLDHSDLSFVKRVDRSQRYGKALTITMAVGVPILLAGLVLQAATTFRDTLAANYPQLKPALAAVCQPLGCKIALPTQLDALSVEPGELASMTENTFSFSTVLRNQSKTPQAWPHVELTLNDNADKPVLRRVFAPHEYLPSPNEADKGFGPRSEQSIKLYFELKELKASGYHIAIFYP
ncbi:MAG TPA: DUF3426 domain-containing protein [Pseudoduganella sp.]